MGASHLLSTVKSFTAIKAAAAMDRAKVLRAMTTNESPEADMGKVLFKEALGTRDSFSNRRIKNAPFSSAKEKKDTLRLDMSRRSTSTARSLNMHGDE